MIARSLISERRGQPKWNSTNIAGLPGKNRETRARELLTHISMLRLCLGLVGACLLIQPVPAREPGFRTELIGSTAPGVTAKSSAQLDLSEMGALVLRSGPDQIRIPYAKVNTLEYGQNVSRRFVAAVLISPVLLLSKSRKHFVTIGYTDNEDKQQALVFRVNKGDIRSLLAELEARTGRRVEYQDNDARKSGQ